MRLILLVILTTSVCAEVSENLIDPNAWEIEGDVLYEPNAYIRFGTEGGSATQTIDFSIYEQLNTIKYGMKAIGCNNEGYSWCDVGTAYDELVITLKYGDEEFVYNVELDYNNGMVAFDNVVDPVATYADSGWIRIYGRDVGTWAGWYGPVTQSHFLEVNYTIPTYDPVKDDPEFMKTITGENQVLDIAMQPENLTEEWKMQNDIKPQEIKIEPVKIEEIKVENDIKQETSSPNIEPKAPAPEIKVEAKQSESTGNQTSKNSGIRLDTVMQNITVDGVSAQETEGSDSYNQIAQAVAMSLLMAQEIKEIELKDAPFYKQEQMADSEMNKVYTGYNAYNSALMNKLVDMQWQN
jgi:hypothetical protein